MLCMASTKGTTLCCLMSRCWMGRWRSSFFVGMAYLGYQRLRLDWRGFYVNFAQQHLTKLQEVQAQTEVAVDRHLSLVQRSPVLAKVFQQAVPQPPPSLWRKTIAKVRA